MMGIDNDPDEETKKDEKRDKSPGMLKKFTNFITGSGKDKTP
jgi:hypothetical protein